jgi:hypothetical protein
MTEIKDVPAGAMFYDGLPSRVGHLENEMTALHEDNIRTREALSTLGSQVNILNETMKDLATKLDVTRTRKPDVGAMAAWAGVLLMIMALVYTPLTSKIDAVSNIVEGLQMTHEESAYDRGYRDSAISSLENRMRKLEELEE